MRPRATLLMVILLVTVASSFVPASGLAQADQLAACFTVNTVDDDTWFQSRLVGSG